MLREELHPKGLEVVTVSLELSDADASRPFIEAAAPRHPSLLDREHRMDALFGVVNVPNVVWIDEEGVIVRPAEPGWPDPRQAQASAALRGAIPRMGRAPTAPPVPEHRVDAAALIGSGQDRASYPSAIRDWVDRGAESEYVLGPDEVVERSRSCRPEVSAAAAHFELANVLWRSGRRDLAIGHFNECHRLDPENWTYKRQAWSLAGHERVGGEFGRFVQGPLEGEEDDWPFTSDFGSDVAQLGAGEYYPETFSR